MASNKGSGKSTGTRKVSASGKGKTTTNRKSTSRKPAAKSRKSTARSPRLTTGQKDLLFGIIILFLTAILTLSLVAPNQGQFTRWLSDLTALLFGIGRYFIPVITGAIGGYLVLRGMEQEPALPYYRLLGFGIIYLIFLAFASLVAFRQDGTFTDLYAVAAAGQGGGYTGSLIASILTRLLGNLGAIITLIVAGLAGAVLLSGISREDVAGWLKREPQPADNGQPAAERAIRINPDRQPATQPEVSAQMPLPLSAKSTNKEQAPISASSSATKTGKGNARDRNKKGQGTPPPIYLAADEPSLAGGAPGGPTWTLPAIADIMETGTDIDVNSASIRERVEIIEHTLESFGAPATVVEINQGPTITQFGVEPNYILMRGGKRTKVKVGKIASLADDLALALAARSIRIQAPVPGKGYVGIEVPNSAKALVSLRDVMESSEYAKVKSPLRIGLGQNVAGQPIVADLAAMPHLLIAGTTGSGKSVCVNGIIACLLLQNTPDDLRLVMVDPKRVELTGYNGVPHLAAPVVVDMDRVIGTLQWALREMDSRYKLFADVGARNIGEYNKKINRSTQPKLPYIVIVVDELADLMMLAPEDTERSITRLAQMARATGIHMVIATQRPSVDVVTGLIKANFPARIAFAVASSTDSRVILDTTGAERLLGQGDMLFQSPDAAAPVRLQGCFVSDGELHKLIAYWQTARRSQFIAAPGSSSAASPTTPNPAAATRGPASRPVEESPTPLPSAVPPPVSHLNQPEQMPTTPAPQRRTPHVPSTPPDKPAREPTFVAPQPYEPPENDFVPYQPASTSGITQQPLWEALQEMENGDGGSANAPEDDLLPEAIALVRSLNKASTSLLQRRFRIGYTRAARLMDALEDQGIIGPPTGTSKAREVYHDGQSATTGPGQGESGEADEE